ncbi:response regulator [Dyella monticola]|nr:response regulator [Dyella monticola]
MNAFVVEDDPTLASTLMDAMVAFGITVIGHAGDVPSALAWLDKGLIPDLALIDILLPSGPAYPIVDRLRELPTALVLITGLDCTQIKTPYRDITCLEKPFGMHELLEAITNLVDR